MTQHSATTLLATATALLGFAANSLLCRRALAQACIDPVSFTAVRIGAGALMLWLLVVLARLPRLSRRPGSWRAALALFCYALLFSLAYVRLSAGTGALLLFGAVQTSMLGVAVARGERLLALQWGGLALALAGLCALLLPGALAPDPSAALLMVLAGVAWACYTLCGKGGRNPLAATAGNFLRAVPLALLSLVIAWQCGTLQLGGWHAVADSAEPDWRRGLWLAVASGALASGTCYALWYTALRGLTTSRAALVQLLVPVLAATLGVVLLGEDPSWRLVGSGAAVLAGVALALRRA